MWRSDMSGWYVIGCQLTLLTLVLLLGSGAVQVMYQLSYPWPTDWCWWSRAMLAGAGVCMLLATGVSLLISRLEREP